ncbi:MAG: hypothetical protein WA624_07235 [Methylocella sp.]
MPGWSFLRYFVLMPLGALALAKVLWLDNPFAVGLLVLGVRRAVPKLAECQGQPRICRYAAHRRNILDDVLARLKDGAPAP